MTKSGKILIVLLFILCASGDLAAKPTSSSEARKAVNGWLKLDSNPLGTTIGTQVGEVNVYVDSNDEPIYYIVNIVPRGFVIVSADDQVEPIIGFVGDGSFDPSTENPLGALVSRDLPARIAATKAAVSHDAIDKREKAKNKWKDLQVWADSVSAMSAPSVSDIRVSPLIQSKWNQEAACNYNCYNYYTPNNYRCGCVATAMAQVMRFYQYPTNAVGQEQFDIFVDHEVRSASLRGGDGEGGPYVWSQMPLVPDCTITTTQRQAIGAICYDAGVSVGMDYGSGVSTASLKQARSSLVATFGYSSAVYGFKGGGNIGDGLVEMINPNLDAGYPIILSIGGDVHAVVADGYGYNLSTPYHHINMGHSGSHDAWYNLPDFDPPYDDIVDGCIYNLYITGSGEIISGRVTTSSGTPISGVVITAETDSGAVYTATTNSQGIFALANVPSDTTFTVSKQGAGMSRIVNTGISSNNSATCGNVWGIDFAGDSSSHAPYAKNGRVSTVGGFHIPVPLMAVDDYLPNPPGNFTCIITSLPEHGKLSDPCSGEIITAAALPYILANFGKNVNYQSCAYFTGTDSFYFKANDGGTAPDGGYSDVAAITIDVNAPTAVPEVIWQTAFTGGLPLGWQIVDGGSDGKTWTSTNPWNRSNSNLTGTFMIVDSDWAGFVTMDEQLITAGFDCSNFEQVILSFKHYFCDDIYRSEIADVDVRANGGTWQNVSRYQSDSAQGLVELDISAIARHQPNVQIRWHYYNANWDYYWGVDDVKVTAGVSSVVLPIPGDFGFDCMVDFQDLAILTSAWMTHPNEMNWNQACDISTLADNVINMGDFAVLADHWLGGAVRQIVGDFGSDGKVDFEDFAALASAWKTHPGEPNWNPACDISSPADNIINMADLAIFAGAWLQGM